MRMFSKKTLFIIPILCFAVLAFPQQSDALQITPAVREITLTPGQTTSVELQVENDEQEAINLNFDIVNFTAKPGTGEPQYLEDATPTGAATWVDITDYTIVVEPGATESVVVNFDTPTSAEPGGHYVGVLFNMKQAGAEANDGQVNIESKIGVPMLITVRGDYEQSGDITAFATADNKDMYTSGPITFDLTYKNTGDVHLKPTGTVTITNMFGSNAASLTVNDKAVAILPDNTRPLEVSSWSSVGSSFGKYTAEVQLTDGTVTDTATISFWVLSTTGIIIAVVVLIVLIILIALLIKALTRGKPEQMTPGQ